MKVFCRQLLEIKINKKNEKNKSDDTSICLKIIELIIALVYGPIGVVERVSTL